MHASFNVFCALPLLGIIGLNHDWLWVPKVLNLVSEVTFFPSHCLQVAASAVCSLAVKVKGEIGEMRVLTGRVLVAGGVLVSSGWPPGWAEQTCAVVRGAGSTSRIHECVTMCHHFVPTSVFLPSPCTDVQPRTGWGRTTALSPPQLLCRDLFLSSCLVPLWPSNWETAFCIFTAASPREGSTCALMIFTSDWSQS